MMHGMYILGINRMEGIANYLYHPEKICVIMEDTGELVLEVELKRCVREELAKEKLAEEKSEKNKEKRLAEEKKRAYIVDINFSIIRIRIES
jgi:hypothetical protein